VEKGSRQRCAPSTLTAEGKALERKPAYLARMQARKAVLQAQAARLRAQEPSEWFDRYGRRVENDHLPSALSPFFQCFGEK